jgi:cysteine desulfurase
VLLRELRGLALSTGSACSSGSGAPSHVLAAIGLEKAAAASTLRISLGRGSTESDIDTAARAVETAVPVCRARFGEGF